MTVTPFQQLIADQAWDGFQPPIDRLSNGTGIKQTRMAQIFAGHMRPTFDEFLDIVRFIGGKARRVSYNALFPDANSIGKLPTIGREIIADDSLHNTGRSFRLHPSPNIFQS